MKPSARSAVLALVCIIALPNIAKAQSPSSDGAIGWCVIHDSDPIESLTVPLCVNGSGAVHATSHVDALFGSTYAYKKVDGLVGVHFFDVTGGVRVGGPLSAPARPFGEISAGYLAFSSSGITLNGFVISPGVGVDVYVSPNAFIRPQFNVLIEHLSGDWTNDVQFTLSIGWERKR